MDRVMNEPLEQRVKILELKVQFFESWKSSSFIQVTLPVIVSLALASTWANTALSMMRDDISSLKTDMNTVGQKLGKVEQRLDKVELKLDKVDQRLGKIEEKLGV